MSQVKRSTGPLGTKPGERTGRYNGTYIGIVKENRDASMMGRLKVWIPEMSSTADDASSWILVQYASPFAGSTPFKSTGNNLKDFKQSQTSYGMWFVPPDVDAEVLVTFINGDASKGIWFACVYGNFMNQMVPGDGVVEEGLHYGQETSTDDSALPVGEYNRTKIDARIVKTPDSEKKPINPYKSGAARDQGLIFDSARGPNSSSARRESPSNVYGISTPGPFDETTPNTLPYKSNSGSGPEGKGHRMGGSSIVFDDAADVEHVTLKTRSGAQIKIAEADGFIYLNNVDGSAWLELSPSGHVDIYGAKSVSVRAQEDINFRADRDINMEAGRNVNIRAAKDYLSKDEVVEFLSAYANTQQKTIANLFTDAQKKDYIKDFPNAALNFKQGKLDLEKSFVAAIKEAGYDIRSINPNLKFTPEQEIASRTTLTSVDLLHMLRGSHIVGQSFGTGGNVSVYAFNDIAAIARNEARLSTYDGSVQINSGQKINVTAGTDMSLVAGLNTYITTGNETHFSTGTDFKHLVGGHYMLNVLNDWVMTVRGEIRIRHEGLKFKFEGVPTEFSGSSRVPSAATHSVEVKAGAVASQYTSVDSKIDEDYNVQSNNMNTLVLDRNSIDAAVMSTKVSGSSVIQSADISIKAESGFTAEAGSGLSLHGASTSVSGSAGVSVLAPNISHTEGPAPGPSLGPVTNIPSVADVSPGTTQVARPESGTIAAFAITRDVLYSKSNVLPVINKDGNKEYSLTYHRQEVESIVRRFITHEPCVEHEVTGGTEVKVPLVKNHIRFRILD